MTVILASHPRLKVFRRFALDLATLSKCRDRGVAALIVDEECTNVFAIGINGGPKGGMDCLCGTGKYTCAHAEANALAKCNTDCHGRAMICTLSPCVTCATLIVNSGITTVYIIEKYKDETGIKLMLDADIRVVLLEE